MKINKTKNSKICDKLNSDSPIISLITCTKNSGKYLEECLQSIQNQTYKNIQHIIIDGDSTDDTSQIIEKYRDQIDVLISEKDKGIYDAFNKGMLHVKGDYFGFVNSDDILMPNALSILIKYIRNNKETDFFFWSCKKTLEFCMWFINLGR